MTAQDSATPLGSIAVGTDDGNGDAEGVAGGAAADAGRGADLGTVAVEVRDAGPSGTPTSLPRGALLAALGVVSFSLTFPGTAWGLESFGPWSLVCLRIALSALIAGALLAGRRVPLPARAHWAGLAVVAGGSLVGFPLLTTLALETSTTSHAAVVIGLLPLATAALGAVRTGRRPSPAFWTASLAGAAVVAVFTVQQSGGALSSGDICLFAALLVCAAAYVEGGRLAAVMPGWQVVAWSLVLCLPLALAGAAVALVHEPWRLTGHGVAGLLWLAAGSNCFGLYVWYRGLAAVGVPRASQLQLAQPLLTLVWSVLLLGEHLSPAAPLAAGGVLVCIAVTQRARS